MSTPDSAKIRIEDLVTMPRPAELAVSPEGARVAFSLADTDLTRGEARVQVHVAPGTWEESAKSRGADPWTQGFDDAHTPAWSPDGRWLAFLSFRPQPHEDEDDDHREDGLRKLQVFAIPAAGGEAKRMSEAPEGVELFRWKEDSSGVVALAVSPRPASEKSWRQRRHDNHDDPVVVHGEIPELEFWDFPIEGDPLRLHGGLRGVEDFDLSPDGRTLAYATSHTGRPEDAERVEVILRDLGSGESRPASRGRGGCETTPRFSRDGRYLYFCAWADPALAFSRQDLAVVSLEDEGAPPRLLLESVDRDLEGFVTLPGDEALALVAWGLESRALVLAPQPDREARLLPVEGKVLSEPASPHAEGRAACVVESGSEAPELSWLDTATGQLEPMTTLQRDLASRERARRERVSWENEGFEHEGLLVLPARAEEAPFPLFVWLHGGPHWRGQDRFDIYDAEAYAAEGWAVFVPQYRGSSGSDSAYAQALRGDLGGAEARDVLAGVECVAGHAAIDAQRVALGGASYGGYLTNWLLATTDRFRAGVSVAGIFDLAQDFGTSEGFLWEISYLGGAPWERPELYRERSPLTHAADIRAPVLILHGLEDDNTYFSNAKALYRALVTLRRPVELVVYPREGHGIFEPAHRIDAYRRTLAWLQQHVREARGPHVPGRRIEDEGVALIPFSHQVHKDYCGLKPREGSVFLEVSFLLRALEGGPDTLAFSPAGPDADVALVDEHGDLSRPLGVPVDTQGHAALLVGGGVVEAWQDPGESPASLPVSVVFEVPDARARYWLSVASLPGYELDVDPGAPVDESA